jgi:2-polyprenyl-3-methyl-5-hydroxy-6-metoxy-1,4-benzoquinol methylase
MDAIEWHQRNSAHFSARYDCSPAFRERLAVWTALIAANARPGDRVLDAGCGPGLLACCAARRGARVDALDGSASMIEIARANAAREGLAEVDFHLGSIGDDAALKGRRFDVILCSSVLEYVPDLDAALDWLAARLGPGAALIVSMPNGRSSYRRAERLAFRFTGRPRYYAFVRHAPSVASFVEALQRRGLATQTIRYYGGPRFWRWLARGDAAQAEPLFAVVAKKRGA